MVNYEWLGWIATGLFTTSFFFKQQVWLLRLQMVAASLWIAYGVLVQARPVVVANVLVAVSSAFLQYRLWREKKKALGTPLSA